MAVVQLLATFTTYKLIDLKGRRFLLILSLVGCAVSHAIMVAYMQINSYGSPEGGFRSTMVFQSIPILCMASVIYMASIGIVPLTFICTAESFPNKIRPVGMTFGNIVLNLLSFLLYKIYPLLQEMIGLQACLMIFGVSCTFGIIYVAILVEETKGKELNEVIDEDEVTEVTSLRRDLRRLSQHRRSIQPFDVRRYSVVSFA